MTPPGRVGVREPRGRLGGLYAKNVTICPTQACNIPRNVLLLGEADCRELTSLCLRLLYALGSN